jgi:hypothetical protein
MIESNTLKLSVFVNFSDPSSDDERIEDVCILLLQGKNILRGRIIGKNIDESDDELKEKILNEEVGEDFFDSKTRLGLKNINTEYHENVIEYIFSSLKLFKSNIMNIDGSDEEDDQYVIYNDNMNYNSKFFSELTSYIIDNDDTLYPTSLKDIFLFESNLKSIFNKYGYKNIEYIESSSISNALFSGIAFDLSLGYR